MTLKRCCQLEKKLHKQTNLNLNNDKYIVSKSKLTVIVAKGQDHFTSDIK